MLFNSVVFLFVFFPLAVFAYFLTPNRFRWLTLLLASVYFYMCFVPKYILILFFTIIVDYVAGILIAGSDGRRRKVFLLLSILANVGVLAFFKYFNFFAGNLNSVFGFLGVDGSIPLLAIILPIGLSFHTFQSMSYTIEVYRNRQPAERHLGVLAVYVLFFPQLVAGPIERPQNLLSQFKIQHQFSFDNLFSGLKLIVWGLFKKVVIADRAAIIADQIFASPQAYSGLPLILGTVAFAIQIYCDFSGYSDMAIGTAKVMGFNLMKNFDEPYRARSISDFWRRWHISLTTWFKDYVYIPLGGSRVGVSRWYLNLLIIFLMSGLWHGANWTFIFWGALNGFYLIFSLISASWRGGVTNFIGVGNFPRLQAIWQMTCTFILVNLGWVFFRSTNFTDAWYIISNMLRGWGGNIRWIVTNWSNGDLFGHPFFSASVVAFFAIWFMFWAEKNKLQLNMSDPRRQKYFFGFVVALILLFGIFQNQQFIYFQF